MANLYKRFFHCRLSIDCNNFSIFMENNHSKISEDTKNKSKIAFVFGIFMTIFYCVAGIFLMFSDIFVPQLTEKVRISLGVLFVLYGIYRGYRVVKK